MQKTTFNQGDVILREGERGNQLVVVKSGTVEIYKGDVLITTQSDSGGIYGEMSALLNEPYSATVKAASQVEAYVVSDATSFLKSKHDVCYKVNVLLARRLSDITRQLAEFRSEHNEHKEDIAETPAVMKKIEARVKSIANSATSQFEDLGSGLENYEVEILDPGSEEYPSHIRR